MRALRFLLKLWLEKQILGLGKQFYSINLDTGSSLKKQFLKILISLVKIKQTIASYPYTLRRRLTPIQEDRDLSISVKANDKNPHPYFEMCLKFWKENTAGPSSV